MWRRLIDLITRRDDVFISERLARAAVSVDGVWVVHSMSVRGRRASLRVGVESGSHPGTVGSGVETAVRRALPHLTSVSVRTES